MFQRRKNRLSPELNTTSTADISFMLLTFFLVTSSMDIDKGITRQLPVESKQEQREVNVDKSRIMKIGISDDNRITIDDKEIERKNLAMRLESFIGRKKQKHAIVIDCSPEADYATYFFVENTIGIAYQHLRDRYSLQKFGHHFKELGPDEREETLKIYPMQIAETAND